MVEGVVGAGVSTVSDSLLKLLVGFLAIVGAVLIIFGLFEGHVTWVLLGAIIIILALFIFVALYIMGIFGAVKESVQTARQVKDLVDEVAPGAIPAVQKGVQRGLDAVSGRRPMFQAQDQQQQPYQQQPHQQQPHQQQPYQQDPYAQQPTPPPQPPEPPAPKAVGPLYHPCPTCGAGNAPGDAYCHYCKRPLR